MSSGWDGWFGSGWDIVGSCGFFLRSSVNWSGGWNIVSSGLFFGGGRFFFGGGWDWLSSCGNNCRRVSRSSLFNSSFFGGDWNFSGRS